MKTYKPRKLVLPEHLIEVDKVMVVRRDAVEIYVDEEYAYQYAKVIYKFLHRRKRKKEMDGEVTE